MFSRSLVMPGLVLLLLMAGCGGGGSAKTRAEAVCERIKVGEIPPGAVRVGRSPRAGSYPRLTAVTSRLGKPDRIDRGGPLSIWWIYGNTAYLVSQPDKYVPFRRIEGRTCDLRKPIARADG